MLLRQPKLLSVSSVASVFRSRVSVAGYCADLKKVVKRGEK